MEHGIADDTHAMLINDFKNLSGHFFPASNWNYLEHDIWRTQQSSIATCLAAEFARNRNASCFRGGGNKKTFSNLDKYAAYIISLHKSQTLSCTQEYGKILPLNVFKILLKLLFALYILLKENNGLFLPMPRHHPAQTLFQV